MADIRHRVGIAVPPEQVFEALATTEGLSGWWTRDVRGDASLGGTLRFYFGRTEPGCVMDVVELEPNRLVTWRCVGGPDEWVGTTLRFALSEGSGQTIILFTHADWAEPVEFLHHCSTRWAYFLLGLKAGLEGGKATPFPEDEKIDDWG
ncbi:MAG TPA: SRPBCC domain-containing protein [Acidimicrobiales bacterium]|nr:SRPBCC domain-containing protein [Acidimicrobiales bacterium]